jgi:hypothetical protein
MNNQENLMPRAMLYSNEMADIAKKHFNSEKKWQEKSITVEVSGIPIEVLYYYNADKNAVVIPAPLAVKKMLSSDFFEPDFEDVIQRIEKDLDNKNFMISGSLIGKGAGECHYVAFHKDNTGKMALFDSKFSDPDRFLSSSDQPTFWEKLIGYLQAPFRFLAFYFGFRHETEAKFLGQEVKVFRLGTQSVLDGVSCGYHSIGAVLTMSEEINRGNSSLQAIEQKIKGEKALDFKAEIYFLTKDAPITNTPEISHALRTMPRAVNSAVSDSVEQPAPADKLMSTDPSLIQHQTPQQEETRTMSKPM